MTGNTLFQSKDKSLLFSVYISWKIVCRVKLGWKSFEFVLSKVKRGEKIKRPKTLNFGASKPGSAPRVTGTQIEKRDLCTEEGEIRPGLTSTGPCLHLVTLLFEPVCHGMAGQRWEYSRSILPRCFPSNKGPQAIGHETLLTSIIKGVSFCTKSLLIRLSLVA